MNPYVSQQHQALTSAPRIDLLLALYDGAIERMTAALADLKVGRRDAALPLLNRAQLIIAELAAGVVPDVNPPVNYPILHLYEFVASRLAEEDIPGIESSLRVLGNLREGFRAIRAEAIELERTGQIPPADALTTVSAVA